MKKIVFLIVSLLCALQLNAQQQPLYTHYLFNPLVYNPAYASAYDMTIVTFSNRTQWMASPAPFSFTNYASLQTTLPNSDKMGISALVLNDIYGPNNNTDIRVGGAYRLPLSDYTSLSFGLQGLYTFYTINNSKLNLENSTDPNFPAGQAAAGRFNVAAGLYLQNPDRFYLGLSSPHLLNSDITKNSVYYQTYSPSLNISGGMVFGANGNLPVRPSFMVSAYKDLPVAYEGTCSFLLSNIIWAGVSVRNMNMVGLIGQMDITDHVRLGFSYDIPINDVNVKSWGTFEIMANVNFPAFKNQTVVKRYF
jgi:type IX secretion system PorP/SprF family membrane protein